MLVDAEYAEALTSCGAAVRVTELVSSGDPRLKEYARGCIANYQLCSGAAVGSKCAESPEPRARRALAPLSQNRAGASPGGAKCSPRGKVHLPVRSPRRDVAERLADVHIHIA